MIIFSLSTVIGFACAIGIDMGFNTTHHHEGEAKVHIHKDGKKHVHKNEQSKKDDCCNDKVVKISQDDKALSQSLNIINPVFFTPALCAYYHFDVTCASQVITSVKYFARSYHPPIPDIRIAIRSFQI